MTGPDEVRGSAHDDFGREERAFADAFRGELDDEAFRPLDPQAITQAARPQRRLTGWTRGIAAAAAVVLAVVGGGVVLSRLTQASSSASTAAGPAEGSGALRPEADAGKAGGAPVPGPSTVTATDGEPAARAARPGNRWESYRNVRVQVPDSWTYAFAPNSDWCAGRKHPTRPYVDLVRGDTAVAAILCTGRLPDDQQAMHLTFSPAGSPAPWREASSAWRQYRRSVGEAVLTVTARAGDAARARAVLATAEVVPDGLDPNGCPVVAPEVPAADLGALDPTRIVVCQYEAEADRGAFRAATVLTGEAADRAWREVLAAPAGGGPDSPASECGSGQGWPVVLLVGPDRVPVLGSLGGCTGNGVADASAANGLRALTRELCGALLRDPVRLSVGYGPSGALCMP